MTSKRKICFITGTRAEYGLLSGLLEQMEKHPDFEVQLVVTGSHLVAQFGLTHEEIVSKERFLIREVQILLASDSEVGVAKSMGLGLISFADAFDDLKPDLVVVIGDRFETFSAASAALVLRIPIAHIHGGEKTFGSIDDAFRHAITKMAHLHFTVAEEYRTRVIQLGETPDRVFNVGALGVDNFKRLNIMSQLELEQDLNFEFGKSNALVTYHPATWEPGQAQKQFNQLLEAFNRLGQFNFIFTAANADTEGDIINRMIETFVKNNIERSVFFKSLGSRRYLSMMTHCDVVVGNSSSGILEAPTACVPVINIGTRQEGRLKADNVIDCEANLQSILNAFNDIKSSAFKAKLSHCKTDIFGDGNAAKKIIEHLKNFDLEAPLAKKFYDLI